MEEVKPDLQKQDEQLAEQLSRVRIDPLKAAHCRIEGCRGMKGYTVVLKPGGNPEIRLCCGTVGETEYERLTTSIKELVKAFIELANVVSQHDARMNNLFIALDEHLIDLHRSNPWGFIVWKSVELWRAFRGRFKKNKGPDADLYAALHNEPKEKRYKHD
ncbi:MAG: hypothetical protein WC375_10585 [Methanomassiliicoccales archaeon]|jgi:hypothetical protein